MNRQPVAIISVQGLPARGMALSVVLSVKVLPPRRTLPPNRVRMGRRLVTIVPHGTGIATIETKSPTARKVRPRLRHHRMSEVSPRNRRINQKETIVNGNLNPIEATTSRLPMLDEQHLAENCHRTLSRDRISRTTTMPRTNTKRRRTVP